MPGGRNGAPCPAFNSVMRGSARGTRSAIVPAVIVALGFLAACGGSSQQAQTSPTPSPSPSPLACTSAGTASANWTAPESRTGTSPAIVSAVADGDVLTLTFDQGTPAYEVHPQSTAHFSKDPSGIPVDLSGTAGATIILRGFRGDMQNYVGPVSITSSGPRFLQVYKLGDFEGVITWGAGLSGAGCANVTASGSTLTFRFVAATS
jgi:hypothetical protein